MYWWVGRKCMVKVDTVIKVSVEIYCARSVSSWKIRFRHPNLFHRHISSNVRISLRKEKVFTLPCATSACFMETNFFFYRGFLSRPSTNHRTAGEGGRHFFSSSLTFPPTSQALRH